MKIGLEKFNGNKKNWLHKKYQIKYPNILEDINN